MILKQWCNKRITSYRNDQSKIYKLYCFLYNIQPRNNILIVKKQKFRNLKRTVVAKCKFYILEFILSYISISNGIEVGEFLFLL